MDGSLLKQHWLDTLAVAADAIDAGTMAHALAPDVVRVKRNQLSAERAWVESVEWPDVERTRPGTLVRIEARGDPRLGAVKRAA
jgi:hypothetical protein